MKLLDEVRLLHERMAQLERGPTVVGDWHRFEARVARLLIAADSACLDDLLLSELRMLRLCAQARLRILVA
jgi:hypothetical protein